MVKTGTGLVCFQTWYAEGIR